MYSYVEKIDMEKQFQEDKPNLVGLNRGLDKQYDISNSEPKRNPLTDYVEKKTKEEFVQFLCYNEDLKLTKKLQELNDKGVISINYQKPSVDDEDIFTEQTKQKARIFFIGLGFGMLVAMLI